MTDTSTIIDLGIDLDSLLGDDPPEDVAHIVKRQGQLGAGALIEYAREHGLEVEALCSWKWVPQFGHAPDNMTPCTKCVAIWQSMGGNL